MLQLIFLHKQIEFYFNQFYFNQYYFNRYYFNRYCYIQQFQFLPFCNSMNQQQTTFQISVFINILCDLWYDSLIDQMPSSNIFSELISINWTVKYQMGWNLYCFCCTFKCLYLSFSCILVYHASWIALIFIDLQSQTFTLSYVLQICTTKRTVLEQCLEMWWWKPSIKLKLES